MAKTTLLIAAALAVALWLPWPAKAAPPPQTGGPEYTVQPGDTLIEIAVRHNLALAELIRANNIPNPSVIFPGQVLVLPGAPVPPAESSPEPANRTHTVQPGETLFIIAGRYGASIGAIVQANHLPNADLIEVGQVLQIPTGPPPTPAPPPPPFETITLSEPVIIQGRTLVVHATLAEPDIGLTGEFEGRPLFFTADPNGGRWTIVAIHALTDPNFYPVKLTATRPNGSVITATQTVQVISGPYGQENIQVEGEKGELLNADLIEQERQILLGLWSQVSLRPHWAGAFAYPVAPTDLRLTSQYGTRRSYNGGPVASFHGGADFGGGVGVPIYAPAAGAVVLADSLTVRGNAMLIDHGVGLFSGYWHMSQLAVTTGQQVQPGDLLGYMGDTGLVTGPHLHWELRLQGIAVDPLQWVQETIP
jgi:murein DD-endopeptidase MepM/ murein hydrolase activator NlpD